MTIAEDAAAVSRTPGGWLDRGSIEPIVHPKRGRCFTDPILFCGLVVLAFLIRLGYVLILGGGLNAFPTEGTDGGWYDATARAILRTGVYAHPSSNPTVAMPPGESAFLALLYALGGYSLVFAKCAHMLLLSVVSGLTFLLGRDIFGRPVGVVAGLLVAADPSLVYLSATFLSEPLFIFLIMLAMYVLVRSVARRSNASGAAVIAGLCFGLAALTRNQGMILPISLLLCSIVTKGKLLPPRIALLTLLITFLVLAPWTYRNYQVTGAFVLVSSNGGLTLWSANNPEFVFRQPMPMSLPIYDAPSGLTELETDRFFQARAISWIVSNPGQFALNAIRKVYSLYTFDPQSVRTEKALLFSLAGVFPYGLTMPFIVIGLWHGFRNPQLWIPIAYVLTITALSMVFWGDSRVRAAIQPCLYLFGASGLAWYWIRLGEMRRSQPPGQVG